VLDRGDEDELDRLACDERRAGVFLQEPVGVGLQPREIGRRRGRRGRILGGRRDLRRRDAPRPGAQNVEARVRGDPVEPGAELEAPVAAEARARAPRAQEGLLDEVLRVLQRAEQPVAVDLQLPAVVLEERGEVGADRSPVSDEEFLPHRIDRSF